MLLKNGRHLRDFSTGSCPYHSMARLRLGRQRRNWLRVIAKSALAVPTDPLPTGLMVVPGLSPPPIVQHILGANDFTHIKEVFLAHRATMASTDFTVLWVRLAKMNKEPAQRLSPELQKFVDIMACATLDRMQQFTPSHLCSVIWAASKLKKGVAQSGMFKSFLKTWAIEMEPHLDTLELDQLRKIMAATTRVGYAPGPSWKHKIEMALAERLMGCTCPKTLACCLVSAASQGFALHPAPGFREAIAAAAAASFARRGGLLHGSTGGGGRDVARLACSSLWASAVLGVPLSSATVQTMLSHVTDAADESVAANHTAAATASSSSSSWSGPSKLDAACELVSDLPEGAAAGASTATIGLTPLDFAQVFWALSKLRYTPDPTELSRLLAATSRLLPLAQPELLATILWGLADLEVVPPDSWLQLTYSSFERQLEVADAEPLQALLHAAATLQLPAPHWSARLMERLQDVDLRVLPDGNVVDLVMSMHALAMHPPPQLAHRLQEECIKRLKQRSTAAAAPAAGGV